MGPTKAKISRKSAAKIQKLPWAYESLNPTLISVENNVEQSSEKNKQSFSLSTNRQHFQQVNAYTIYQQNGMLFFP
jgi:hypothetical protein